jgi:hypothetical protein
MERQLTVSAMNRMRRAYPESGATKPAIRTGLGWKLFSPVYARIPWGLKQTAMRTSGMTAAKGWTPPRREPNEPWTPPVPKDPGA